MEFKYKITKFDNKNKTLVVAFDGGHWAEIALTNPLPSNIEELEKIIQRYTAPVEVIEAQLSPSADLSYIESFVEVERTAERFSLASLNKLPKVDSRIPVSIIEPSNQIV
jgi:hypothetical protein